MAVVVFAMVITAIAFFLYGVCLLGTRSGSIVANTEKEARKCHLYGVLCIMFAVVNVIALCL